MKFRKILVGALAAAMVTAAVPLSVTVSAEGYNVGDFFYAAFNSSTGEVVALYENLQEVRDNGTYTAVYDCEVLDNKSIAVTVDCFNNIFINKGERITVPSAINGYTVTEINGCTGGYASVTIPDTVKKIRNYAFILNVYLEEIKFGANSQLEVIGSQAFRDCRSLKSITIPASVKEIGEAAFVSSATLSDTMPEFSNINSLTTVKFAEGSKLETIGDYAFQMQSALKSIDIPDGVKEIGEGVFSGCSSLTSITIPDSATKISYGMFAGCSSLREIEIPDSVTEIGEYAFASCPDNLTIYASSNSYAETYANVNGINFVATNSETPDETTAPETTTAPEITTTPEPEATTAPATTTEAAPTTEPATTTAAPTTDPAPSVGSTDGGNATADKQSADTGAEGVAVAAGIAIVAAAAIIITKKKM